MISYVLLFAVNNSINEINSLRVVVPEGEQKKVNDLLRLHTQLDAMTIVVESEKKFIKAEESAKIDKKLPQRQGWIRQQVIANRAVQESNSSWVLLIDADTVLLKPRLWVNWRGQQVLMPTEEFHQPYYAFLYSLSKYYSEAKTSFVSHHMVYDVKLLVSIMEELGGLSVVLDKALLWSEGKGLSPFDLKYEIYAQYLFGTRKEMVRLQKWANASLKRKYTLQVLDIESELTKYSEDYASVSFHHWNK
jgi:hypothetical protein